MRRNYLTPDWLASVQIDTPDPQLASFYGEELLICYTGGPTETSTLHLHLLFGNYEWQDLFQEGKQCQGYARYRLLGEDYCQKKGIVAFKVEFFDKDERVATYTHPLWAEPVRTHENATP